MLETLAESKEWLSKPVTVAYVFPGQGSQYTGMGEQLIRESKTAQNIFNRADDHLGYSITDICINNPHGELSNTVFAQPAIYTHSVAIHAVLEEIGFLPDFVAGHSMGEIPALVAAGGLEFEDGLDIVCKRAELMDKAGKMADVDRPGGMGFISGMEKQEIEQYIDNKTVYIANINAPNQIVVSGYKDAIGEMIQKVRSYAQEKQKPLRADTLDISIAAHSPLMAPVVEEFRAFLNTIEFKKPNIPIILNRTNDIAEDPEMIKQALVDQLTRGVDWVQVQERLRNLGVNGIIEVGPRDVLAKLAKKANIANTKERILASDKLQGFGSLLQVLRT
ncbi:MAG TPA: ACP S-malonyltransferase [Candidatus Levybacteria bacterium]|nr:ACP S-malonyltransferase [Candidatus Levybacteria bacterium]